MSKNKKIALYMHGGSANHGCEALARTITSFFPNSEVVLFSGAPDEDLNYIGNLNFSVYKAPERYSKKTIRGFIVACRIKFLKQRFAWVKLAYKKLIKYCDKNTIALSIGGDNYCYDGKPQVLAKLNARLNKKGTKTVLLGCSIEPDLLKDEKVIKDLSRYSLITARESITYNALINSGVKTDIRLIPDSAFLLPATESVLPNNFLLGNTIGINVSPLVKALEKENGILIQSYYNLIDYILKETNMSIAFIPHVLWGRNNDLTLLREFYEKYSNTGRVCLVEDRNAEELKYVISKCRFLVAARTHASIAAYSTSVPTLVVGYSVKSLGIATDLFGTTDNYVVSVDKIKKGDELVSSIKWLLDNEQQIRSTLDGLLPNYIENIHQIGDLVEKI